MKYSTRDLVTMAVFGSLWGISEISLGTIIKSLNIPLRYLFSLGFRFFMSDPGFMRHNFFF